jgi:hypothetical protein
MQQTQPPIKTEFKATAYGESRSFDTREEADAWVEAQIQARQDEEAHFSS